MKIGKYLDSERYDTKGRLVIHKGFRIGAFHFANEEIRLTQEELADIGLRDERQKETKQ